MHTGEHLDQRRFPGAVVTHQGDHLARMHVELDVRQGRDRSEVLRDAAQTEHQLTAPGPCCGVVSHGTDTSLRVEGPGTSRIPSGVAPNQFVTVQFVMPSFLQPSA
ncbi:MAG: hypothetical protein JWR14_2796 [Caballeronia sp.]|nr:hypothetical protein [Caballeronia sp.]